MSSDNIQTKFETILWNVAREECCLTKQKANCIVMVTEHDMKQTAKRLLNTPEFIELIKDITEFNKNQIKNNI